MSGALVLAAHGSRREPEANSLVRRLAESVRARRLFDQVTVAFHQGEPRFDTVLDELTAQEVTVVPLLTSAGHYATAVLPRALAQNRCFSDLRLRQTPPVGTHPGIPPLVARRITELLRERGISRSDATIAIAGHGTRKHPESRNATIALADTLRRRRVAGEVLPVFLDDDPPLESILEVVTSPFLVVIPFLIGGGTHVVRDIPDRLAAAGFAGRNVIVDRPLGEYPGLAEIVVDLARRHPPPPAPRFRPRAPQKKSPGTVYLVGSGPGDPGLITVRGMELIRSADVVIHDRLIGPELLTETRAGAVLIDVGKGRGHAPRSQAEIQSLLVLHAQQGRTVVRLKGGDPFVFGRGIEEVQACELAGVRVEIVPGVSSAIAAPGAAGIPVTARGVARSFAVMTAERADHAEKAEEDPSDFCPRADTLVILMGRDALGTLAARLIAEGRDPSTPAACIQSATTPEQRVTRATLATIAEAVERDGLEAPVVTVIGKVAGLAREEAGSTIPFTPLRRLASVIPAG